MNIVQIKETCLYFHDLREAKTFYHELLKFPIIGEVEDKHIFFQAGSCVLLCFNPDDARRKQSPPAHYGAGKLHLAFEVREDEYYSAKEEIRSKGIPITAEVIWSGGKESFYFEDPAGNVLEIVPNRGIWN
jgi:catechol-2,3-dioxygenase